MSAAEKFQPWDIVKVKWDKDPGCWRTSLSAPGVEAEVLVVAGPQKYAADNIFLIKSPKNDLGNLSEFLTVDQEYLDTNSFISCGLSPKHKGYEVTIVTQPKLLELVYRPHNIGDKIFVKILYEGDGMYNITRHGNDHKEVEVVGRLFENIYRYKYYVRTCDKNLSSILIEEDNFDYYQNNYDLNAKIGDRIASVYPKHIIDSAALQKTSGLQCMNRFCKELCPWAEQPNCPNNVFLCYSCRTNPTTYQIVMSQLSES